MSSSSSDPKTTLLKDSVPGTVVYATCRWSEKERICCQQFHREEAQAFYQHLAQHVQNMFNSRKKRRASLPPPPVDAYVTSAFGLVKESRVFLAYDSGLGQQAQQPVDKDSGWICQWHGCTVQREFKKKTHFKSHVTGMHNPFPLFQCLVTLCK
jgi:hypothetical protein